jgi:hypothetical protein
MCGADAQKNMSVCSFSEIEHQEKKSNNIKLFITLNITRGYLTSQLSLAMVVDFAPGHDHRHNNGNNEN